MNRIKARFAVKFLVVVLFLCCFSIYNIGAQTERGVALQNDSFLRFIQSEHRNVFIVILIFGMAFFFYLRHARRGTELFLRPLPGLKAIEEAVGRATEMGKPVLYVPGLEDIDEIQTLASLNILPYVAELTAEYGAPLIVTTRRSVVMSVAEEIVKEAHLRVGRPDTFNPNNIRYLSDEQFAFTAAIDGIMLREKPAANLYFGAFFAESLILSETGFAAGAIQIAGTASAAQLPFFIAACDYTLIGEEFYAASAYLSHEPTLLAGIKAADMLKIFILFAIIAGVAAGSLGFTSIYDSIIVWF